MNMKNKEDFLYDIELVYDEIIIDGDEDETTSFCINIALTEKRFVAKIPNNIRPGERVRLRGMGKQKTDGTMGNAYISFNSVKCKKTNSHYNKYEYKVIEDIYDFNLEEILNNYGNKGWQVVRIIDKQDSFNIVFERKI